MLITISNKNFTASINPKGAELSSLKLNDKEYMWEGDPKFWGKHSPVLFPIVGTLKNNTYLINDKEYHLPRHGFARDNAFTIKSKEESKVTFSLISTEATKDVYPFDFELELIYSLTENTLKLEYVVSNTGNTPMPFCLGAHPAFALPGNFEDYSLIFEKDEPLVSTQLVDDLLSDITAEIPAHNKVLPLQHSLFANDALIFTSLKSRNITIAKNQKDYLKVSFPTFPHLGLWTKLGAPFICIEPWQGYSDTANTTGDFYSKDGCITINPSEQYSAGWSVEIC